MGKGDGEVIKVTTKDNPKYQEFEDWSDFDKTNQVLHSHNDKPSFISYYKNGKIYSKHWHLNGKYHRSNDKPSYIYYYESGKVGNKQWHLDDNHYTERGYKQIMKQIDAMSDTEKLLDPRWWVRQQVK